MEHSSVLWYGSQAGEWVEALPVGNGRLGAMVFGGVGRGTHPVQRRTLWTGQPHEDQHEGAVKFLPQCVNFCRRCGNSNAKRSSSTPRANRRIEGEAEDGGRQAKRGRGPRVEGVHERSVPSESLPAVRRSVRVPRPRSPTTIIASWTSTGHHYDALQGRRRDDHTRDIRQLPRSGNRRSHHRQQSPVAPSVRRAAHQPAQGRADDGRGGQGRLRFAGTSRTVASQFRDAGAAPSPMAAVA